MTIIEHALERVFFCLMEVLLSMVLHQMPAYSNIPMFVETALYN